MIDGNRSLIQDQRLNFDDTVVRSHSFIYLVMMNDVTPEAKEESNIGR